MKELSPFQFNDYREYLRTVREKQLIGKKRKLTFRHWAKELEYKSPRSFGMVMKGERIPSQEMTLKISKFLEHTDQEQRYFELLVMLARSNRTGRGTEVVLSELRRIKRPAAEEGATNAETVGFLAFRMEPKRMPEAKEFLERIKKEILEKFETKEGDSFFQVSFRISGSTLD